MKVALLLVLSCWFSSPLRAWIAVLETPSFRVEIEHACEEGCVSCDQIRYRGTNKKTKQSLALVGSTVHTMGADGKAPSHFLGYRFINGSTAYFVSDDGLLEVTQNEKRLLREQGAWDDQKKEPNQPLQRNASTGSVLNFESPARRG